MTRWSLLSVRLRLGVLALGVGMGAALLVGLFAFQTVRSGYDRLAQETLPQIADAARVAQISQAIASTAPALTTATTEVGRLGIKNQLSDQLRDLDRYLGDIELRPVAPEEAATRAALLANIRGHQNELTQNLAVLDTVVARRIESLEQGRALSTDMQALSRDLQAVRRAVESALMTATTDQGRRAELFGALAWADMVQDVLNLVATAMQAENLAVIRRLRDRAVVLTASVIAAPVAQDPVTTDLAPIAARISTLVLDPAGGFGWRLERVRQDAEIAGLINQNRILATRFVGSITDLTRALAEETEQVRQGFDRLANDAVLGFFVAMAALSAGLLGLTIFLRRRLSDRLLLLEEAMRARVDGQSAQIPAEGSDEIAAIGRAARHFVETISEREQSLLAAKDDAMQLAQEAEQASRAKSFFLANMSHELRTPLNAIIGFSDLIASGAARPDKATDYAQDINASGRHLLTLINDLLDYSKLESGQRDLRLVRFAPRAVLDGVARLFAPTLDRRGLTLAITVDAHWVIEADELAFRQVMLNLMSNAVKFAFEGTTITIAARSDGGRLELTVSDRGIGIAPDQLDRVLQPFQQEDTAYARASGGTGLGLAIVESLVRLHGGAVRLESVKNQFTSVSVSFALVQDVSQPVLPLVADSKA